MRGRDARAAVKDRGARTEESMAAESVVVTGATGFIGEALLQALRADGMRVVVLARDPVRAAVRLGPDVACYEWNGVTPPASAAFDGACAVIHLAGEPIAGSRWTPARKAAILGSRRDGTRALVEAMAACATPPPVLVSASAIGYYGSRGDAWLREDASSGDDFLAEVCRAWEDAALRAVDHGIRVVTPRIGLVLDAGGGALAKLLPPARLGLGGPLGSGRQWWSWIHRDDLVALLLLAVHDVSLRGALNAVAPEPVTNAQMAATLGRVLGRPAMLPAPAFALRLLLGEMADMLLGSQRVAPARATAAGFRWRYATLEPALRDAVRGGDAR